MDIATAKKIAYNLTMEHIKQTEFVKKCGEDPETVVKEYFDLYNKYLEILKKKPIINH